MYVGINIEYQVHNSMYGAISQYAFRKLDSCILSLINLTIRYDFVYNDSMSITHRFFIIFIFLIFNFSIKGQNPGWWHISDQDGLPGNTVYEILQDDLGYMWIATNGGLSRFDGRVFSTINDLGFRDNEILELKKDSKNRIWFTNVLGELAFVENDTIFNFSDKVLEEKNVSDFWIVDNGIIVVYQIENNQKVFEWYNNLKKSKFELISSKTFYEPVSTNKSNLIPTEAGYFLLSKLFGDNFLLTQFYKGEILFEKLPYNTEYPTFKNKLPESTNTGIMATHYKIYRIDSGDLKIMNIESKNNVLRTSYLETESFVFGLDKGVYVYNLEENLLKKTDVFQNLELNCVFKDYKNNYWIGTSKDGIYVASSLNTNYYGESNSKLSDNFVYSIYGFKNRTYIGQSSGNLTIFEDDKFVETKIFSDAGALRSIEVEGSQVYLGYESNIKLGDFSDINDNKLQTIFFNKGTRAGKRIAVSKDKIAVATAFGVGEFVLNKNQDKIDFVNNRITNVRSYGLCYDHRERLWIGTTEGIIIKDHEEVIKLAIPDSTHFYNVPSIVRAEDNSIWAAVNSKGIYRIVEDTIQEFYSCELSGTSSLTLYPDGDTLWIGGDKGLAKLDINSKSIENFTISSGLPSNEINAIYGTEESLWIGTPKGLVTIPRNALKKNTAEPSILITDLTLDGKSKNLDSLIILNHNENDIEITYTGFSYSSRGKETYRYRMLGYDTTWQETKNRSVSYYGLKHGAYKFEVKAVSSDKIESADVSIVEFKIKQLWYTKWWIQLSGILTISGLVIHFIYSRQRKLLRTERRENEFQKRIDQLKMQALQSQMNPHFIFNTLNGIQDYLLSKNSEKAINSLSDFSRMLSFVFENSEKKEIALSQEIVFLKHYLALEKMRFGDKISIEFFVSETINSQKDEIFIPPLLIQPIIENAFQHGLHHKTSRSNLTINIMPSDKTNIKCEIIDDGVGREKAKEFQITDINFKNNRTTSGLKIVEERISIFHEVDLKDLEQFLLYTDLKDSNDNSIGTKVEIWL